MRNFKYNVGFSKLGDRIGQGRSVQLLQSQRRFGDNTLNAVELNEDTTAS